MSKKLIKEASRLPFYEVWEENGKLSEIICKDFSLEYFLKDEYKNNSN